MDVAVLWSLNIRTVLVHGAGAQIAALAAEKGIVPSDLDGSGVTDAATLQLALTGANRVTHEVLAGLSVADLRGACTNAVIAHPMGILRGVDHLQTGCVERIDSEPHPQADHDAAYSGTAAAALLRAGGGVVPAVRDARVRLRAGVVRAVRQGRRGRS